MTSISSELPIAPQEDQLEQQSWLKRTLNPEWYRLVTGVITNPLSIVGMLIISVFLLMAAFAPVLAPKPDPQWDTHLIPRDGFKSEPQPPGSIWKKNVPDSIPFWYQSVTGNEEWVHLLGTTSGQYDIWYGLIWGSRTALLAGSLVALSSFAIGLIVGAVSGFYGGLIDELLMRTVEVFIAFPFLVGALILASLLTPIFGRSIWPSSIALIIFGWTGYARQLRGDILVTKEREYVLASRASGATDMHLILQHILPNAIFPSLVRLSLNFGAVVLSFAALSFLGVGVPEGYADWGQIISFARSWILSLDTHWYIVAYPGIALLLYGLGWNLIGDALRDILDPKLRGHG